jgi:hypothetical protein
MGSLPCVKPPVAARLPPLPPSRGVLLPTPVRPGTGGVAPFADALAAQHHAARKAPFRCRSKHNCNVKLCAIAVFTHPATYQLKKIA